MPKRGLFEEKIPEYVARLASGLEDIESFDSPVLARHTVEAIKRVALMLSSESRDVIYCPLCRRGPFTRKGYYLHLTRIHGNEILELVNAEVERITSSSRHVRV